MTHLMVLQLGDSFEHVNFQKSSVLSPTVAAKIHRLVRIARARYKFQDIQKCCFKGKPSSKNTYVT